MAWKRTWTAEMINELMELWSQRDPKLSLSDILSQFREKYDEGMSKNVLTGQLYRARINGDTRAYRRFKFVNNGRSYSAVRNTDDPPKPRGHRNTYCRGWIQSMQVYSR